MENYEQMKKLGSGNFGVTYLMKHKESGEIVAVKQMLRGSKINKNVYREVLNHRKLSHPNVIGFKAVYLDEKHLNIIMEYASGVHHVTVEPSRSRATGLLDATVLAWSSLRQVCTRQSDRLAAGVLVGRADRSGWKGSSFSEPGPASCISALFVLLDQTPGR